MSDPLIQVDRTLSELRRVSEARVPLEHAENARVVAFRPRDGGVEHLAIVIGEPDLNTPVLVRLHAECFTGDLIGSLRCGCGNQLRGAIVEMARAGSGVLLYLAQEGRGVDSDERNYLPAAQILRLLGIARVRLMTNNPVKVDALARYGIDVVERVAHVFPSNEHNEDYLQTKATKSGHIF